MKNKKIVCLSIVTICMLTSCDMLPVEKEILQPPTVRAYEKKDFKLIKIQRDTLIKETYIKGEFLAAQRQDIFYEKGDFVIKDIYVSKGDFVNKGQLIAETENEDLGDKIEASHQEIKNIELAIQQSSEKQDGDIKKEQEKLDTYNKEYNRAKDLESNLGSQNYVYTKNDIENLIEKVEVQKKEIEKLFLQHKMANDKLAVKLEIENQKKHVLEQQYNETKVFSNVSGEVTFVKAFEQGDKTFPEEILVKIIDKSTSLFRVDNHPSKVFNIGDKTEIICNEETFNAEVISPIGVVTKENIKENSIYMNVLNLPSTIKEGTSGKIYVLLGKAEQVLYLPKSAINTANGESFVYSYDNALKEKCVVKTGFETDYLVEIVNGLTEGQIVLVE